MSDDFEGMITIGEIEDEIEDARRDGVPIHTKAIDLDYEACVIGAVLLSGGERMHEALDIGLSPDDFASMDRRIIWRCMKELHDAGKPVTTLTLLDAVIKSGRRDDIGGSAAISRYEAMIPSTAIIGPYSKQIVEDATRRRLHQAMVSGKAIISSHLPIAETVSAIEGAIARASARGTERAAVSAGDLIDEFTEELTSRAETLADEDVGIIGIRSPWPDVDKLTHGFTPLLFVLAARPSMGKTACAGQIALHAAVKERIPTMFFSSEQKAKRIIQRLVSCRSGVPLPVIIAGKPNKEQTRRIIEAGGEIADAPLWIDDTPNIDIHEMRQKARKAKREHDVGMIVVDYLQLLTVTRPGGGHFDNETQELGEATKTCKQVQRETDACFILLSQLNRSLEGRTDKRPMMSDLRGSGSIEQDADVIAFLYREEYYLKGKCPPETKGVAEMIFGKNRDGPPGTVSLAFKPEIVRFENLTDDHNF